jgi:hypothetical protein
MNFAAKNIIFQLGPSAEYEKGFFPEPAARSDAEN